MSFIFNCFLSSLRFLRSLREGMVPGFSLAKLAKVAKIQL